MAQFKSKKRKQLAKAKRKRTGYVGTKPRVKKTTKTVHPNQKPQYFFSRPDEQAFISHFCRIYNDHPWIWDHVKRDLRSLGIKVKD